MLEAMELDGSGLMDMEGADDTGVRQTNMVAEGLDTRHPHTLSLPI